VNASPARGRIKPETAEGFLSIRRQRGLRKKQKKTAMIRQSAESWWNIHTRSGAKRDKEYIPKEGGDRERGNWTLTEEF